MAEVIPIVNDVPTSKKRTQRGKYLPMEALILVREVRAMRAHVAAYGTVKQSFEQVVAKINLNPHMIQKITGKAVQDRYNRLQNDFQSEEERNSCLFDVAGGEMGDLYQMLSQMQEEAVFVVEKGKERSDKQKKEQEKEQMGREVVKMALMRRTQRSSSDDRSENDEKEDEGSGSKDRSAEKHRKGKCRKTEQYDLSGGFSVFAEKLKEADMARIELETKQLEFEKEKWSIEKEEREKDRAERKREREDAHGMELRKFELMLDVLRNKN